MIEGLTHDGVGSLNNRDAFLTLTEAGSPRSGAHIVQETAEFLMCLHATAERKQTHLTLIGH